MREGGIKGGMGEMSRGRGGEQGVWIERRGQGKEVNGYFIIIYTYDRLQVILVGIKVQVGWRMFRRRACGNNG